MSQRDSVELMVNHMNGDEVAFNYCYKIQEMKKNNPTMGRNVEIRLNVTRFVPSLPSKLIVDNRHLLSTIPRKRASIGRGKVILKQLMYYILLIIKRGYLN